jgi:hypothetical protein
VPTPFFTGGPRPELTAPSGVFFGSIRRFGGFPTSLIAAPSFLNGGFYDSSARGTDVPRTSRGVMPIRAKSINKIIAFKSLFFFNISSTWFSTTSPQADRVPGFGWVQRMSM